MTTYHNGDIVAHLISKPNLSLYKPVETARSGPAQWHRDLIGSGIKWGDTVEALGHIGTYILYRGYRDPDGVHRPHAQIRLSDGDLIDVHFEHMRLVKKSEAANAA